MKNTILFVAVKLSSFTYFEASISRGNAHDYGNVLKEVFERGLNQWILETPDYRKQIKSTSDDVSLQVCR